MAETVMPASRTIHRMSAVSRKPPLGLCVTSSMIDRYMRTMSGMIITNMKHRNASPVTKSNAKSGMLHSMTNPNTVVPSTMPMSSSTTKILRMMSRIFPKTDTTFARSVRSGSSGAVVAGVFSRMLRAVMRSPFISSFCRAEDAGGTANHMMM